MPQQSLSEFVNDMEKAGMLVRIKEEKRVDELPGMGGISDFIPDADRAL